MTARLQALTQTLCVVLFLVLIPGTAHLEEQQEPAAAQPANSAEEPAAGKSGLLTVPLPETRETATPETAAPASPAAGQIPSAEAAEPYIIKQGDTLWDISNTFYKDPFLWPFIWKANPAVTNPDLIFTGDNLTIPSLGPIEHAIKAEAAEQPLVKTAPETAQQEKVADGLPTGEEEVKPAPAPAGMETPAQETGISMPEEQAFPIIDKYALLSMGYVNDEEETGDSVTGSEDTGRSIFGYGDIVYVSIKDPENVNIGDKYLVFVPLQKVKHPRTGKSFGKLIRGQGLLQITAKDPDASVLTARITLSFNEIEKGSLLTPYEEPTLTYQSSQKKAKDISGYIIEVMDKRSINAQTDAVYLDKGEADGVEPGDHFIVYAEPEKKGFPKKAIGEARVVLVKQHTSTAVVNKSRDAMGKGDAVVYKN